jgi:hypothetical protein
MRKLATKMHKKAQTVLEALNFRHLSGGTRFMVTRNFPDFMVLYNAMTCGSGGRRPAASLSFTAK